MTAQDSQYMWQNVVVEVGFRHHFLLHGILAVAATHKASVFPSEQEELLLQSASHIEIGLQTFRKCLESPLPILSVPVFLFAGLLSVQTLGTAQVHAPVDPIGDVCMWMRMVKGAKSTINQNWELLLSSEIGSMLHNHTPASEESTDIVEINDLRSLVEQTAIHGTAEREVYLECVDHLRRVFISDRYLAANDKQSSSMPGTWAATVNEGFCDLLAQRQPLALVIIAFFSTLFRTWPGIWWYRNWDTWILNAIQLELPVEYEPWLQWPRAKLNAATSPPTTMAA